MKILHIINNLGSGGAEKLLTLLLPLMKKEGHDVSVIIANSKENVLSYERTLIDSGVKYKTLSISFYNPMIVFKLIKEFKKENYEVVHAHLFPTQHWVALASFFGPKRTSFVKTEHSVFNERQKYLILKPLEKLIYSRYHLIIAITDTVKQQLISWIGVKKCLVINNGLPISEINQISAATSEIFDKNYYNILMTGRFDGVQKDQKSLIKAVAILNQNVQLYFAGEGPNMSELKEYAISLKIENDIHFLGMRTDIYLLMASVDLNVLSTIHEGLSGVTLEALASGKPFIGSDVAGVNDVVPDRSFLFPKSNPEALAQKITLIKENPELSNKMVEKSLIHVKKYDISNMVDGYLKVYNELLS